jgi:hypothetical protein
MASLAPGIAPQHATSLDHSHNIMTREGYKRDDWRILTLNDAAEDALSKILRFGFDIDRDVAKPGVTMRIKNQIIAWAKHISDDIPGYSNWQEIYDFTFDALDSPDAVPASKNHHRKLPQLGEPNLDPLSNNIPDYPRTEDQVAKVDAVVDQAGNATRDWQTSAVQNHRPIRTGTSGHMLSYCNIFVSSEEPTGCKEKNHPTLEQLRLTLLAALIDFNQHHTYDEFMTASHGFTHRGITLEYKDRKGFRDIFESEDAFIQDTIGKLFLNAMVAIGKQVIANFNEVAAVLDPPLPPWDDLVAKWFKDTTGRNFPIID